MDLVKLIIKRDVWAILNGYWERNFVLFSWTVRFSVCVILNIKTGDYVNRYLIAKHYILHMLSLGCCLAFYTVFTQWVVNLEISSAVPCGFISEEWDVTLFAVEHKNLRITNYVYKFRQSRSFEGCLIRATDMCTCRVTAVAL